MNPQRSMFRLAVIVGLAISAGSSWAQTPPASNFGAPPVSGFATPPQVHGPGPGPYSSTFGTPPMPPVWRPRIAEAPPSYGQGPTNPPPEPEIRPRHHLVETVRRSILCCWTHHNCMGCGSIHSEATFHFGSCRQFFGENCPDRKPELPWVPNNRWGGSLWCNCP